MSMGVWVHMCTPKDLIQFIHEHVFIHAFTGVSEIQETTMRIRDYLETSKQSSKPMLRVDKRQRQTQDQDHHLTPNAIPTRVRGSCTSKNFRGKTIGGPVESPGSAVHLQASLRSWHAGQVMQSSVGVRQKSFAWTVFQTLGLYLGMAW